MYLWNLYLLFGEYFPVGMKHMKLTLLCYDLNATSGIHACRCSLTVWSVHLPSRLRQDPDRLPLFAVSVSPDSPDWPDWNSRQLINICFSPGRILILSHL